MMIPKFRAWYTPFKGEKYGRKMKYGSAGSLITHAEMSPDKYILMQSTGLKDKNGVEIYEGDIYRYEYLTGSGVEYRNSVVEWETTEVAYTGVFHGYELNNYEVEVIGNIYENLELTKEVGP